MVGQNGVNHVGALAVLARQLCAQRDMGALGLMIDALADVVQKARPLGQRHVRAQLGGHHAGQMADLDGMLEHVLAVAGAVAQTAQNLDQLVMDAVLMRFKHGLFARLADLLIHFLAGLFHHFLDAGGMDAAVHDEALHRDARDLAPDGVKGADNHRFGGVVNNQVHTGGGLQGADVAALAADDAALHVVVG